MNGFINKEKAMLKLRGGGKFKYICFIVLYVCLYRLQNKHVQGFQYICPSNHKWLAGFHTRPPSKEGYEKVSGRITVRLDAV